MMVDRWWTPAMTTMQGTEREGEIKAGGRTEYRQVRQGKAQVSEWVYGSAWRVTNKLVGTSSCGRVTCLGMNERAAHEVCD